MVFSSLLFVFAFLAISLIAYFFASTIKQKNVVLLLFSLVFYSWGGPKYLVLLIGLSFWSWFTACRIADVRTKRGKKVWMFLECFGALLTLGFFKYTGFFLTNLQYLTGLPKEIPNIVLPIGISFYTFQLLSYVVDVYREEVPVQRPYWKVLLYCSLFHQCIAGPIVRYQTVADEIENRSVTAHDVAEGVRRFCVGLAKKAVLANTCASLADTLIVSDQLATASIAGLWIGMLFYMLQIYLDFSAYSDMAIGMGRMVGFHYLENFNYPYIAVSVKDFWHRWHISLSTFFRDYVYIPLGGNRKGSLCTFRNLFVVWFLTGMWHGASWNYILWGLFYFVFLVIERLFLGKLLNRIPKIFGWIYTILVVYFGWVIFRFENMQELITVLKGMFDFSGREWMSMDTTLLIQNNIFFFIIAVIAITPIGKIIRKKWYASAEEKQRCPHLLYLIDMIVPAVLLLLSVMALVGNSYNPFLYFQF